MNNKSHRRTVVTLLIIFIAVGAILWFSHQKYPIELIEPAAFAKPAEIGHRIYAEPAANLASQPLIVFGVAPSLSFHGEIVSGLVQTAYDQGKPITTVYSEVGLAPLELPQGTEVIEFRFSDSTFELAQAIRSQIQAGKRVLIYTANILSSHLVDANPIHRFESDWGEPVVSVSTVGISLHNDPMYKSDPVCMGSERDGSGTAALGCAAVLKGRQYDRKGIDEEKFVAIVDRRGLADLLIYVSVPKLKN